MPPTFFSATAASIKAGGDLKVDATNIALLAGQAKANTDSVMTTSSSDLISSTTTRTQTTSSSATAQVNQFSGKNVTLTAGQDLVSVGSRFTATDALTVEGKNSQSFFAAKDVSTTSRSVESSSSMFGGLIGLGNSSSTDTSSKQVSIASELQSTQAINVNVGNSASFEGAKLTGKNIAFTNVDPTKAGQLNLNGSVDTTQTTHTSKSETLGLYQSQSGSGSTTQTLNLTKINGDVTFDKGLGVNVQLPKVVSTNGEKANTAAAANATNAANQPSVQAQIDQLAKQPGLGYLDQLSKTAASTNPTQWSQVQLAHDKWSYQAQGLTPAGAALLSIAVAAYTGGMGAELLGGTAATTTAGVTTAATLMGSTALGAAANAGFASLAAQAAVAMVNNGGDVGKTLQQLGSEQSVKSLLTSMVTAGALDALGRSTMFNGQSGAAAGGTNSITTGTSAASSFSDKLLKNVTNNVAGAAISSAINGQPLDEKALSGALTSALLTTGLASGANTIGDAAAAGDISAFTQKLAHAALGCAGGAAMAGNGSGCSAGAVGAVVGEMAAEYATTTLKMNKTDALSFAKVLSAASGVLTGGGGDNVAAVNVANTTGANAAQNNYLSHTDATTRAALKDKQAKGGLSAAEIQQLTNLEVLDIARDLALKDACQTQGDACNAARRDLNAAIDSYATAGGMNNARLSAAGNKSVTAELNQNVALSNDPKLAQQTLLDSFKEFALPQAAGYAAGAVIGKFIGEAQAVYSAIKAEASAVPGALASGGAGVKSEVAATNGTPLLPGGKTTGGAAVDEVATISTGKTIIVDSKGNALVGDWSPTKTLTSPENAGAHWTKHSPEFPQYSNTGQYVEGAQNFVTNPPLGTLTKVRPNGDTLFFDPASDTFAVQAASGAPRTMFKPDPSKHGYSTNLDYFNAQK